MKQKDDRIKELESQLADLLRLCADQAARISFLEAKVLELRSRLSQNSSNSSKPPSSDLYKKNGRKPHILTDTLGLVWGVVAGAAHQADGAVAQQVVEPFWATCIG